jgi:hypothetical protein
VAITSISLDANDRAGWYVRSVARSSIEEIMQNPIPHHLPPARAKLIIGIGASALVLAAVVVTVGTGNIAEATIAFRNDTGKACSFCHATPGTDMKNLSRAGERFRDNGYKLEERDQDRDGDRDRGRGRDRDRERDRDRTAHRKPSWCTTQANLNEAEGTICDSRLLSDLDERLNRAYRRSNPSRESQREWVRRRNECDSNERCLVRAYEDRLAELE